MPKGRIFRWTLMALGVLMLVVAAGLGWCWLELRGSLPQTSGEMELVGLEGPVRIERDALGIPTIHARSRHDLAMATGFLHGQERFFQMDLMRRDSAGELSELVGGAAVDRDRQRRVHRFRDLSRRAIEAADPEDRALAEAYVEGVNQGLKALRAKPPEYIMIGGEPAPWTIEDTVLVQFSMYLDLQGDDWDEESARGLVYDIYPPEMADFLSPPGSKWDAPADGSPAFETPPVPTADVINLRQLLSSEAVPVGAFSAVQRAELEHFVPGSNNWAVAGTHTSHGGAIVANDMHLGIMVPGVWYRARWLLEPKEGEVEQDVTGVTLPGTPAIVVGSNGHIAWAFTNSEGDWSDLVVIEPDPADENRYLTPDGPREFERHTEVIKVKGEDDETMEIVSTIWGPVIDADHQGRQRALRWVAHDPEGVNFMMAKMINMTTLEEALDTANRGGIPAQNFVVADDRGRIAWTILGPIPRRREGFDGRVPTSWADGSCGWDGFLTPEEYPRIVDPESGRIWTANARIVGGEMLARLGDGGYDLGARQQQIRDDLLALDGATEQDMLDIQLDDRAVFLERWRELLLEVLDEEAVAADPRRAAMRGYVDDWGGRASIDSVGFRLVRDFRLAVTEQVLDTLTGPLAAADENFRMGDLLRPEGPVWRLVEERPEHMLHPRFENWDEQLLAAVDVVLAEASPDVPGMAEHTWGAANTTRIQHPLSQAVPQLSSWLDMPSQPLPGSGSNMPRIQRPTSGASERLAVSPGREQEGYFHMPCGQSGHFLSPHYGDGHAAWADGEPTPFLPGETVEVLTLVPAKS